jgi:hypothetical protein
MTAAATKPRDCRRHAPALGPAQSCREVSEFAGRTPNPFARAHPARREFAVGRVEADARIASRRLTFIGKDQTLAMP